MAPGSDGTTVLDLHRTLRTWRSAAVTLLGAGGLAVTVLAVVGAVDGDLARLQGLALGLPMIAFAVLLVVSIVRQKLVLIVDATGFAVEQEPIGGFAVSWSQVATVRLVRERRRSLFVLPRVAYTLELTPAGRRLGGSLEDLREGRLYRYALGQIGVQGRRADEVLQDAAARFCPASG